MSRLAETFLAFLLLGLTSFGGPVAHLGYFHTEFVTRRKWLDEADYADLVALCQALPGPASSQVGIAIGHRRAGLPGAIAAFVGFTLPSVLLLYALTLGANLWNTDLGAGILHGLKLAAVAVVALAVWQMATKLTPDWPRCLVAIVAAIPALLLAHPIVPVAVIALAAFIGACLPPPTATAAPAPKPAPWSNTHILAAIALVVFVALLVLLPVFSAIPYNPEIDIIDRFYRTGSLVFGGGHVVLPLLETELVAPGLIDRDLFLAGYGAAQALPGPLFSFAFYAGTQLDRYPNGVWGGLLALFAIYLPSFLLVLGILPFWDRLRARPHLRHSLNLVNAAVVGLLLAALIDPVILYGIGNALDVLIVLAAVAALWFRTPPWLVVLACGSIGAALTLMA